MKKVFLALACAGLFVACNKDDNNNNSEKATLKIAITDAPGDYAHIYLQVTEIAIKNHTWETLTLSKTDTFDILNYTNGNQLILADAFVSAENTSEIRLVLADDNYLVLEDGTVHNIKVPSGQSSGLKIKLNKSKDLQPNQTYYVVLDFDASQSIVKKGNGEYSLKPVIRGYWEEGLGAAEGFAFSSGYQVSVHALNGTDTLGGTLVNQSSGYYKIAGLPQANYTLLFNSSNGKDSSIANVVVQQNITTLIDTVSL